MLAKLIQGNSIKKIPALFCRGFLFKQCINNDIEHKLLAQGVELITKLKVY